MKLWYISQDKRNGYDAFDGAVVAAETEEDARKTHPIASWGVSVRWDSDVWVTSPEEVSVQLIGEAAPGIEPGIILASFNAG